jgi:hypothetical protein
VTLIDDPLSRRGLFAELLDNSRQEGTTGASARRFFAGATFARSMPIGFDILRAVQACVFEPFFRTASVAAAECRRTRAFSNDGAKHRSASSRNAEPCGREERNSGVLVSLPLPGQ